PIFSMPDAPIPSPFTIAKAGTIIWRLVETPILTGRPARVKSGLDLHGESRDEDHDHTQQEHGRVHTERAAMQSAKLKAQWIRRRQAFKRGDLGFTGLNFRLGG